MSKKKPPFVEMPFAFLPEEVMGEEMAVDLFHEMTAISQQHMSTALELTKLIVQQAPAQSLDEARIYAIYKQSLHVVKEQSPVKKFFDEFEKG